MTKYKGIIFDLGNVLFEVTFSRCFSSWAKSTGLSPDEVEEAFKFDHMYEAHEKGEVDPEDYAVHVGTLLGKKISFEDFEFGWNSIYGDVVPETFEFISHHQNDFRFYAFTNSNSTHRKFWEDRFKSEVSLFDQVFCSSLIGKRKPEHDAFDVILREVGLEREEVIFLDDLEENVLSARKYGIRSIQFANPREAIQELSDLVSFDEGHFRRSFAWKT